MPFSKEITDYIDDQLKSSSLKGKKLQPAVLHGISTLAVRKKESPGSDQPKLELLPSVFSPKGNVLISPDDSLAIQTYHRLLSNVYSYTKRSFGEGYDIKCVSEYLLVVITNGKLNGSAKEALEPIVLFGIPERLSEDLTEQLKIQRCLITPMSSNLNQVEVFRQEYPQTEYFLTDQIGMFSVRYKVETEFDKDCIGACCD